MEDIASAFTRRTHNKVQFCHLTSEFNGLGRVDNILQFMKHPTMVESLTTVYFLPSDNDIAVVEEECFSENTTTVALSKGMFNQGHVTLATYAQWLRGRYWEKIPPGKLVFILDVGLGLATADMELTMATVVDYTRANLDTDHRRWSILVCTVSSSERCLVTTETLRRTFNNPDFQRLEMLHDDCPIDQSRIRHLRVKQWTRTDVTDEITKMMEHIGHETWAFVVVSDLADALRIQSHTWQQHEFYSLGPWSSVSDIMAAARAESNRFIHVNRDTGILPPIADLRMVVVAPQLVDGTFDITVGNIVQTSIKMPMPMQLARTVLGRQGDAKILVLEMDNDQDYLQLADKDRGYFACGIAHIFPGVQQELLPCRLRHRVEIHAGSVRLGEAGLLDMEHGTMRAGVDFSRFLGIESNSRAIILLSSITPDMSTVAKVTRVEMAMLVSHGLHATDIEAKHTLCMKNLADAGWMAAKEAFRGHLWVLLAFAHAYRLGRAQNWTENLLDVRDKIRQPVMDFVWRRIKEWMELLDIRRPTGKRSTSLTAQEMGELEKTLVLAFSDNIIATRRDLPKMMLHTDSDMEIAHCQTIDRGRFPSTLNNGTREGVDFFQWEVHSRLKTSECEWSLCCGLDRRSDVQTGDYIYEAVGMTGVNSASVLYAGLDSKSRQKRWIRRFFTDEQLWRRVKMPDSSAPSSIFEQTQEQLILAPPPKYNSNWCFT